MAPISCSLITFKRLLAYAGYIGSTETPLSTYSQMENSVYGKCTYVKTSIPK